MGELARGEPVVVALSTASDQTTTHDYRATPSGRGRCFRAAASKRTAAAGASRLAALPISGPRAHPKASVHLDPERNDNEEG